MEMTKLLLLGAILMVLGAPANATLPITPITPITPTREQCERFLATKTQEIITYQKHAEELILGLRQLGHRLSNSFDTPHMQAAKREDLQEYELARAIYWHAAWCVFTDTGEPQP